MITSALIKALEYSSSPRSVSAAVWALEKATGIKSAELIDGDWYARNGYRKLAALNGGSGSHAGKAVTIDTALESSAVYACVKIIAEDIGGLPFFPYERSADGETLEKAYGHPLYECLHDAPNPDMSSGEFREAMTSRALLGIDGYATIERIAGRIYMWPLPVMATVEMTQTANGRLQYIVGRGTKDEKTYDRSEIFHLKAFTLDGMRSDNVLHRARHAIGLGLASDEYAGKFFANDATPGLIINRPHAAGLSPLAPEKVTELKKKWAEWHKGSGRAHEPAILQDGMTAMRLDPDHQKLQLIESRKYQITEVARMYRMPLHKLAELDRSTNNNIAHQGIEYVSHGLGPWRRRWEEAVHRCLLTREERYHANGRPRMYAEFNVEAMTRGDLAAQVDAWTKLLEKGPLSLNEVRRFLNLNPVEGGDAHSVQLNMRDVASTAREEIAA